MSLRAVESIKLELGELNRKFDELNKTLRDIRDHYLASRGRGE